MAGDETAVLARAAPSGGARARHGTLDDGGGRDGRMRRDETRVRDAYAGRRPFGSAVRVVDNDDG